MLAPERYASVEIAGRRLAWRSIGSGPILVLVNGYAASALDWDPTMLAALARRFEVICPDNRGVGQSELGDPAGVTIDAMAADIEALLDHLHVDRAPVVGWSMGGFIAQRLAIRAPARVPVMALLSTDPGGSSAVLAEAGVWAELTDRSGTPREQASRLISLLFPPGLAPEIDRRFGDPVALARSRLSPVTLAAHEAAMAGWHTTDQPRPGADPPEVLVAFGSEDVVIPAGNAQALAARWPHCRVEQFTGGGHAFMAQEPTLVSHLIESFVLG